MAANGVGALVGALTLASLGDSPHKRKLFYGGLFWFCGMLVLFTHSTVYWLSAATLAGSGFFMIIFFAPANTSVQTRVPDELRGRVIGIYALAFLGLTPFGSLLAGAIAKTASAAFAVTLGAAICIMAGHGRHANHDTTERNAMKYFLLLLIGPMAVFAGDPDFDSYWHDGKAELNSYQMTISRYGQVRQAQGVAVYVTEPFSESQRVKVDDPGKNPRDVVDALKLNLVRDFQTGIYDYNTMVSVFVRSRDFSPLKVTFSSAEWCGHVFEELLFHPGKITGFYNSYFEGETGARDLVWPKGGISEDSLWILLRGLRGDFLKSGEKKTVPLLTGVYFGRLAHKPLAWTDVEIEFVSVHNKELDFRVPAGDFSPSGCYHVRFADGREGKFWIEANYPHRILRWELLPDISAELTGSARLEYWKLHNNGDERYLRQFGLKPTVPAP